MFSEDRDTVIVFNGEIYNHAELRAELERRGHRFQSRCDTEVVLQAYLEWGRECLPKLRGMFALAIWKESEKRLLLARDRMGIKPLYYMRRGGELHFGSELKAILAHPDVERRISQTGLNYYLSLNYVPAPYTLVDGIDKLHPGHWLEWRDGEIETGGLLEAPVTAAEQVDARLRQGGARRAAHGGGARAPDLGRAAGGVGQRRPGFVHHSALRRRRSARTG